MRRPRRGTLLRAGLGLFVVAVLLQLVPYGRDHTNPPVTQDAPWPDGRSRELSRQQSSQPRGRKPARKDWSSSREAAQRSAGAWNRMAWRRPAATKVMS